MQNQQKQMEVEAEAFNYDKLRKKSTMKGMISEIDQMMEYYHNKREQYAREIEKLKAQRNLLAELLTD